MIDEYSGLSLSPPIMGDKDPKCIKYTTIKNPDGDFSVVPIFATKIICTMGKSIGPLFNSFKVHNTYEEALDNALKFNLNSASALT